MSQVLDYSAGFPGAAAIKGAGYVGAVRYIGFPDRRKCTTQGELDDFNAHQLGMALVFESNATGWRLGYDGGRLHARWARDHANAIGFPADRPVYMATDQDVVTSGEFATMVEYLRGASTSLGGVHVTGVYGEADVIDRARDAGVAAWFWQTAAWSRGRRTSAHLFQRVGTVNVGGIGCDINDVLQDDWGQHNAGANVDLTEQNLKDIARYVGNEIKDKLYQGDDQRTNFYGPDRNAQGELVKRTHQQGLAQLFTWVFEGLDVTRAARDEILASVEQAREGMTQEQVNDVAAKLGDQLGAALGPNIARSVLEEASRRLAGQ